MDELNYFIDNKPFQLESGMQLPYLKLAYHTIGRLNADRNNVVWVFHAFTGNSAVTEWWPDMIGKGKAIDPTKQFVICANLPGSCYGSIGPLSPKFHEGNTLFFRDFPLITIRDAGKAFSLLKDYLGITGIELLIGGSLGGYQALEAAYDWQNEVKQLVLIATSAKTSPYSIAFSESQRLAIEADPTFFQNRPDGGKNGLIAARAMALISYRNYQAYKLKQSESTDRISDFKAASYQKYQGVKLTNRFNAYSYYSISKTMDSHDIGRGRKGLHSALNAISIPTLVIGIQGDNLFPLSEQEELAKGLPMGTLRIIRSDYGHDGFLLEADKLTRLIKRHKFLVTAHKNHFERKANAA